MILSLLRSFHLPNQPVSSWKLYAHKFLLHLKHLLKTSSFHDKSYCFSWVGSIVRESENVRTPNLSLAYISLQPSLLTFIFSSYSIFWSKIFPILLNMPANLEDSAVATGLEKVTFHSKEMQCQRMLKLPHNCTYLTSLVAQTVKHLSTMWGTWVRSLGWEDSLGKEIATHSSTLALKIPWTEELGAGYYPWGRKESGTTERLHSTHMLIK